MQGYLLQSDMRAHPPIDAYLQRVCNHPLYHLTVKTYGRWLNAIFSHLTLTFLFKKRNQECLNVSVAYKDFIALQQGYPGSGITGNQNSNINDLCSQDTEQLMNRRAASVTILLTLYVSQAWNQNSPWNLKQVFLLWVAGQKKDRLSPQLAKFHRKIHMSRSDLKLC